MKRIRQLWIVILVLALLPMEALATMDGRYISDRDILPYSPSLPYVGVLEEIIYEDEYSTLPYTTDEIGDEVFDLHELSWIDQYTVFQKDWDALPEDTYLAVVRKDPSNKTAYLFTIVDGEAVELLELSHPEYVNYFRSHINVELYTDGEVDYADVTFTNSFPATDEGPNFDEDHLYFRLQDGTAEPVDDWQGAPMNRTDGELLRKENMPFTDMIEMDYESWKELYQLAHTPFTGDTDFLDELSSVEQEDFFISLLPLFADWNRPLGDDFGLGVGLNLMRYVATEMCEELSGWREGGKAFAPSGKDGYGAMEEAILAVNPDALESFGLAFPEGEGWRVDTKPFAEYMRTRYDQAFPQGEYAPEDSGVYLSTHDDGTATVYVHELMVPEFIFPQTVEAKGDYAILKAQVYGFWGPYASEGVDLTEVGYFLLHKVAGENGSMIQTIYRSDQPFGFDDVKELVVEKEEGVAHDPHDENAKPVATSRNWLPIAIGFVAGAAVVVLITALIKRKQ